MTDTLNDNLWQAVLGDQSARLVRANLSAQDQRATLEKGVRDAVLKLGASISEVSAVTGLTVDEINTAIAQVPAMDEDLAVLAGLR